MSEFSYKPPFIRSYKEWDMKNGRWLFCMEAAYDDHGVYCSFNADNLDIITFIMLINMLASELGRQLESDG